MHSYSCLDTHPVSHLHQGNYRVVRGIAYFSYLHSLITDNATMFMSLEFQACCKAIGISHLTEASYHPTTNGVAEHLVQTFKKSLRKSTFSLRKAVGEFLIQYGRTSLLSGYSPSEPLNGRQIRTMLNAMAAYPAHIVQDIQARGAIKSQQVVQPQVVLRFTHLYKFGAPCYALY